MGKTNNIRIPKSFSVLELVRLAPTAKSIHSLSRQVCPNYRSIGKLSYKLIRNWLYIFQMKGVKCMKDCEDETGLDTIRQELARNKVNRYYGVTDLGFCTECSCYVRASEYMNKSNLCKKCFNIKHLTYQKALRYSKGSKPRRLAEFVEISKIKCSDCKVIKPADAYHTYYSNADGVRVRKYLSFCKDCQEKRRSTEVIERAQMRGKARYRKDVVKSRAARNLNFQKSKEELKNNYVKACIVGSGKFKGVSTSLIPSGLIEARRILIQFKRSIKEVKNEKH